MNDGHVFAWMYGYPAKCINLSRMPSIGYWPRVVALKKSALLRI